MSGMTTILVEGNSFWGYFDDYTTLTNNDFRWFIPGFTVVA